MDEQFLVELGLDEAQRQAILNSDAEKNMKAALKEARVRSVSVAMAAIQMKKLDMNNPDKTVFELEQKYPYLFEPEEPVFTGPAGGDTEDADSKAMRKALGI